MAKKEGRKPKKKGKEREYITSEELHNMKFEFSIEVPKEDFDELIKAMMGIGNKQKKA